VDEALDFSKLAYTGSKLNGMTGSYVKEEVLRMENFDITVS